MQTPLQLRWHDLDPSEAIAAEVRDEAARLERASDRITGCSVTLEAPSRHHRQAGSMYRVRVEVAVPGARLVVGRDPAEGWRHGDLFGAVKEAFREARRQLERHAQRLDARVKAHALPARAEVARIFPDDGYGFLRTPDGREVYFHAHSVLRGAFPRLRPGMRVRFVEELGEEGPQASSVVAARRRRGAG